MYPSCYSLKKFRGMVEYAHIGKKLYDYGVPVTSTPAKILGAVFGTWYERYLNLGTYHGDFLGGRDTVSYERHTFH